MNENPSDFSPDQTSLQPAPSVETKADSAAKLKLNKVTIVFTVASAIFIMVVGFFMLGRFQPASAQAKSLIDLHMELDEIRKTSAQLFAQLMEAKFSSERVNQPDQIGDLPGLVGFEEVKKNLEQNRVFVSGALEEIESQSFNDQNVVLSHQQLEIFYKSLEDFENQVISDLEQVQTEKDQYEMIDNIFELGQEWPQLLEMDRNLQDSLDQLADLHGISYQILYYHDIFQDELVRLTTNIIAQDNPEDLLKELESLEPGEEIPVDLNYGQVNYEFDILEDYSQKNVNASWSGANIDRLFFGLKHPDGRLFNFMLAEVPDDSEIITIPIGGLPEGETFARLPDPQFQAETGAPHSQINYQSQWITINIYQDDPDLSPVEGTWTLYIAAPEGLEIVTGNSHF